MPLNFRKDVLRLFGFCCILAKLIYGDFIGVLDLKFTKSFGSFVLPLCCSIEYSPDIICLMVLGSCYTSL